jgi:hypothetical protein
MLVFELNVSKSRRKMFTKITFSTREMLFKAYQCTIVHLEVLKVFPCTEFLRLVLSRKAIRIST